MESKLSQQRTLTAVTDPPTLDTAGRDGLFDLHWVATLSTLNFPSQTNISQTTPQKTPLFVFFFDFWALRRHFGTVLGAKTGARSIDFRYFFGDTCFSQKRAIFR